MTLDGIAIPIFTEQAVKSARGELGRTTSRSTLRPAQGERHDFKLTDYRPSATLVIVGAFRKLAPLFCIVDISYKIQNHSLMAKTFPNERERRSRSHMNDRWTQSDTTAARRVLRDCHIAVRRYDSAACVAEKRIAWVTAVVLLRTVGHVLVKVDGVRSKYLNTAIDAQWKKIGNGGIEHEIFHDFIERERNNILKQYNFNEWRFHRNELDTEQGDKILVGTRILTTKSALSEALKWWEFTLGDIEASAHQYLVGARQSSSTVISPKLPDLVLR